jgi:bifunctional UDP-N-acetylglucosamine pyrophosphorylase/glucosamine-1-phosphate N-acetyltransferase
MKTVVILLAAGHGTRMRSKTPKVLHPLVGKPMILHSIHAIQKATTEKPIVVIGQGADTVRATIGEAAQFVLQKEQLGTGHAVIQAEEPLRGKADLVVVTFADMPLITEKTLQAVIEKQKSNPGPITMATVIAEDPRGFGRVVRSPDGNIQAIVEEAVATPEELKIREMNVSVYCFQADWLWDALHSIPLSPKGEYYLTDLVEIAVSEGQPVQAHILEDRIEAIGINTRAHLAEAEAAMRGRINKALMLSGVTIIDPQHTYIEPQVTIGQDSIIWPNTYLQGDTYIGEGCEIGPNTLIRDTNIGNQCKVFNSVLEKAFLENQVDIGPYGHLREGAHLANGVHMGNFGEVKNSYLGPGVKMGHFSYMGDATLGENVNIGAGTITCNYDGQKKHPTKIEKDVFIGSDTMLIAPITIGEGARTGAAAVVTKDVAPYTVVVGIPARAIQKLVKGE